MNEIAYLSKEWHQEQGHRIEQFGMVERDRFGIVIKAEKIYKCDCKLPIKKSLDRLVSPTE